MGNQVDFMAISIDPKKPKIKAKTQTSIIAEMRNSGPDALPKGEGKVHITVNGKFAYKPASFSSKAWKLEGIKPEQGNYEIFAVSKKEIGLNETNDFKFSVRGKKPGKIDITLASSLSANATSSEINGTNQSVSCELVIV